MLEKMAEFFEARLDGYDHHMMQNIEGATEFYPFTASLLPKGEGAEVLDLGCGTGLELEFYFRINPTARVTGIDLSEGMLHALRCKFPRRDLTLVQGSYFEIPFEAGRYRAAVSVESLHHFTKEEKIPLYRKLHDALKPGAAFILTDYFSTTDEEEKKHRSYLLELKKKEEIDDGEFYHFDTPLTLAHEIEVLEKSGFNKIDVLRSWGATSTIKATK